MADEKRPEESEGIQIPDIEQAAVAKLDGMDWHIIEQMFVDYTGQRVNTTDYFQSYIKNETDVEELRKITIGLYNRFCAAEHVFEKLREALVIVNMVHIDGEVEE